MNHIFIVLQTLRLNQKQISLQANTRQTNLIFSGVMSQQQWIQKLNQFKKLQKSTMVQYTILKALNQAMEEQQKMPLNKTFQSLLKSLAKEINHLTLCKELVAKIWSKQQYAISIREQCCPQILKAVTEWIMQFEVEGDKIDMMSGKFNFVRRFIQKNCPDIETTVLIVDEIYEDLRDFLDQSFWELPAENINNCKEYTFVVQADEEASQEIIALLQLLIFQQLETLSYSNSENQQLTDCYISTNHTFASPNYYDFIFRTINYLLCLELNQSQQSHATKLALQFVRNLYCLKNQHKTIDLFRRLMLRTKKAVRYALVEEYIETYQFFKNFNSDHIIEQLEEMVYFRQLIVSHSTIQNNHTRALEENIPLKYFTELFIKAGSKSRIFFSVEDCSKAILKLQLILDESMNINLKFFHFGNGNREVLYHQEPKTELRKLDLKIQYTGLYAIQFDNTFSWIHGKKILYNLHVMKNLENVENILQQENQNLEEKE